MGKISICLQLKVLKQTNSHLSALLDGSQLINFKWTLLTPHPQERIPEQALWSVPMWLYLIFLVRCMLFDKGREFQNYSWSFCAFWEFASSLDVSWVPVYFNYMYYWRYFSMKFCIYMIEVWIYLSVNWSKLLPRLHSSSLMNISPCLRL